MQNLSSPNPSESTRQSESESRHSQGFTAFTQRLRPPAIIANTTRRAAGVLTKAEKRSVRRRLVIVGVAISVTVLLLASLGNYFFTTHHPEAAADKYLSSLEKGNYFNAIDRSAYGDSSVVFLKNAIYRETTDRVESYEIQSIDQNANVADAQVEVTVDGKQESSTLKLVQEHKSGFFNDNWHVDDSSQAIQEVRSVVPLSELNINGQTVKLNDSLFGRQEASSFWRIVLLPGTYSFSLPSDSYYRLQNGPIQVRMGLGEQDLSPLNIDVKPSSRMWEEADGAIQNWIDACTSADSLAPHGCPVSAKYNAAGLPLESSDKSSASARAHEISQVEWKLLERPALWLRQSENDAAVWFADEYKPAQFELSYKVDGKTRTEKVSAYIDTRVEARGTQANIEVRAADEPTDVTKKP